MSGYVSVWGGGKREAWGGGWGELVCQGTCVCGGGAEGRHGGGDGVS